VAIFICKAMSVGVEAYVASRYRRMDLRSQPRQWRSLIDKVSRLLLTLAACVAASAAPNAHAQSPSPTEYQIKAAFLYNFAKFIEWPAEAFPNAGAPIIIGVVGEDPFGDVLDQTIQGKTVNGRPLAVRRLKGGQGLKACHIIFIGSSEKKHLSQVLEDLKGSDILTVGETDRFTQLGGIINFIMDGDKVRFEINADTVERTRLKISSKLLTLAKVVRNERRGGKS